MSSIIIGDLSNLIPLEPHAMAATHGGERAKSPKIKTKYKERNPLLGPLQRNYVHFGFNNTFVGNTVGVNNGSALINGGIR